MGRKLTGRFQTNRLSSCRSPALEENDDSAYFAYVSQQNLLPDDSDEPVRHPAVAQMFEDNGDGRYVLKRQHAI